MSLENVLILFQVMMTQRAPVYEVPAVEVRAEVSPPRYDTLLNSFDEHRVETAETTESGIHIPNPFHLNGRQAWDSNGESGGDTKHGLQSAANYHPVETPLSHTSPESRREEFLDSAATVIVIAFCCGGFLGIPAIALAGKLNTRKTVMCGCVKSFAFVQ